MRVDLLVADVGSTTTVVSAFHGLGGEPVMAAQGLSPTTVSEGDVTAGLRRAMAALKANAGWDDLSWDEFYACSSAAGGLKMTVHGLVYDMTAKAAQEAALGAGAVVKLVTAGELTEHDREAIMKVRPNIVLLAGGVDYGDRQTAVANARRLAELPLAAPVIYAGNRAVRAEVVDALEQGGKRVLVAENVYPRIDDLNVEPTRRLIQQVFEEHIVVAPGMARIRQLVNGPVMPTPGAVMNAAMLLREIIGDVMLVDVGGATTDVHSVTEGAEEFNKLLVSPEPLAKRTVEGDLGVYINAANLVSRIGSPELEQSLGFDPAPLVERPVLVPAGERERAFVARLAKEAVEVAVARHAGRLRYLYGPAGRITVAEGKDLSRVGTIIGTGGPLTALSEGRAILEGLLSPGRGREMYPKKARVYIDRQYIAAATGVMTRRYPGAARRLLLGSMDWKG
ncbi:MAG TPA: DNA mismatch repair protein MutL [Clostridiales bacterium UBA8153]|nr:DNA mismatch repair protein MutL [Clostridiales bacterium UBA8153]